MPVDGHDDGGAHEHALQALPPFARLGRVLWANHSVPWLVSCNRHVLVLF